MKCAKCGAAVKAGKCLTGHVVKSCGDMLEHYMEQAEARLIESAKWSSKVEVNLHTPEGLFTKSTGAIAEGLADLHPDLKSAMSSLNFYYNRAGSNLSSKDRAKWEEVKKKLRNLYDED